MTTYTDVFGSQTVPPSDYGYRSIELSANLTLFWPQNSTGDTLAKLMEVSATSSGLTVTLPAASDVSTGEDALFRNTGANSFSVVDNDGGAVATVASGAAIYLYVTDNSDAAGAWGQVSYGVGTSSVDAATLVGYGIIAASSTLNQSHPVLATATGVTVDSTYRASLINFTGGADTLDLSAASVIGNNFFTLVRNSGTGTLTLTPAGSDTVDGFSSLGLQPGESVVLVCSGAGWFTVGYGRSVTYNFTQLVLDVSAGGTIALSSAQAANKLLTFVGSPSGAVEVQVPATVAVYYTLNSISTSEAVTVKTASGSGSAIAQGVRAILICDGTDVYSAQSATASTTIQLLDGSASVPALSFSSQTNTGLYKYSTSGYGFSVAGVSRFTDDGTTIKLGALTGLVKRSSGTESAAVAGTDYVSPTGTETLTNKTVSLTSNTVSGTKAEFNTACSDGDFVYTDAVGVTVQAYDADTAKTDEAQNFTLPQRSALLTDNDGSFDLSAKQNFSCTPTVGFTLTFTNQADGLSGSIVLVNGANYAIAAHANTKISTSALTRISATGTYRIDYISNGTNCYCTASENLS